MAMLYITTRKGARIQGESNMTLPYVEDKYLDAVHTWLQTAKPGDLLRAGDCDIIHLGNSMKLQPTKPDYECVPVAPIAPTPDDDEEN